MSLHSQWPLWGAGTGWVLVPHKITGRGSVKDSLWLHSEFLRIWDVTKCMSMESASGFA